MLEVFFGIICPVAFGIAGLYDLWKGYLAVVGATRSGSWPSVDGRIRTAEAVKMGMGEPGVRPSIVYDYAVDGEAFAGKRIVFGMQDDFFSNSGFAEKYILRYPVGGSVRVFYDPAQPASSVLEPGFSFWAFVPSLWGMGILIGVCMLVIAYQNGDLARLELQ